MIINTYKFHHFYLNKYLVKPLSHNKFFISYNYQYKTLWFRTYKVASRTIRQHFEANSPANKDIYSSEVGYLPSMFKGFIKFAFVRNPTDKLISAYKDKVLKQNYFGFHPKTHAKMKDFSNFISWLESQELSCADEHIRPQHKMIDMVNLDFLGRFENFQNDFSELCGLVGLPQKKYEPKNKGTSLEVPLDHELRDRIKSLYYLDYKAFYPEELG